MDFYPLIEIIGAILLGCVIIYADGLTLGAAVGLIWQIPRRIRGWRARRHLTRADGGTP